MGYIYKITNTVNGKAYIGKSIHEPTRDRIRRHLSGRGNRIIAKAVKKYGKDAFTYEILEDNVFDEFLPDLEVAYIANHNTVAPHGYNLTSGGEIAKTPSVETRRKMSEAQKGEKNGFFNKKHTVETRRKMSEAQKNRSVETRRKMSEAQKGRKHSAETRRKMSEAQKGRKVSAEARRKTSKWHKGKKRSAETRRKMSEAKKNNPLYKEQCRKLAESNRLPEYVPAYKCFLSLPVDIPLKEKRKLLYNRFPNVAKRTIRGWVQKWLS